MDENDTAGPAQHESEFDRQNKSTQKPAPKCRKRNVDQCCSAGRLFEWAASELSTGLTATAGVTFDTALFSLVSAESAAPATSTATDETRIRQATPRPI